MVAGDGVRYRQWHSTALFSPRRSCLPTGCNNTRNSMASITEGDSGFASASGTIPRENGIPGGYMLAGKALAISLDVGVPVTQDYPGEQPNRITTAMCRLYAAWRLRP